MAGACLFPNARASLHHHSHTRFRLSQCATTISSERRRVVLPRCAAGSQIVAKLLTAAQERAALRAAESSREGIKFLLPLRFFFLT
jgi:hypothetical protein